MERPNITLGRQHEVLYRSFGSLDGLGRIRSTRAVSDASQRPRLRLCEYHGHWVHSGLNSRHNMTRCAADHLAKDVNLGEDVPNSLGSVLKLIGLNSKFGGIEWQEWGAWKMCARHSEGPRRRVSTSTS